MSLFHYPFPYPSIIMNKPKPNNTKGPTNTTNLSIADAALVTLGGLEGLLRFFLSPCLPLPYIDGVMDGMVDIDGLVDGEGEQINPSFVSSPWSCAIFALLTGPTATKENERRCEILEPRRNNLHESMIPTFTNALLDETYSTDANGSTFRLPIRFRSSSHTVTSLNGFEP